ncbi:Rv0361 family membrane protein [Dactylosporangium sp. CA-092794]|uniref:Rv0361 family membrane protein n=1 Tax=Dactylosporangium sp. CA-092794 TaxID=3239929 RepID=UPI003D8A0A1A
MSKTAKIIIFSVLGFVLVCCGGGAAAVFFFVNAGLKEPKAAAGDFLTALEGGNNQAAYQMLCDSARESYGPETFASFVEQHAPASHDLGFGGSYSNTDGNETASITASITYKNGSKDSRTLPMTKEGGAWKVCGNPY